MHRATLYLIPVPLGENLQGEIPEATLAVVRSLTHFVVEHPKTARKWIKAMEHPAPLPSLWMEELNEHTPDEDLHHLLKPLSEGHSLGIMSEAGCPGIADPGAKLVQLAHKKAIPVVPLVGPSSILLALMSSGMNGQAFTFHGYLPNKQGALQPAIKKLEQTARQQKVTQAFIETPYRNQALFQTLVQTLQPDTLLGIAASLTTADAQIKTLTVAEWRKQEAPDLHKKPSVWLIGMQ
jgi:16S rRNA (cytidine1402-2'-O)-methyltransferase